MIIFNKNNQGQISKPLISDTSHSQQKGDLKLASKDQSRSEIKNWLLKKNLFTDIVYNSKKALDIPDDPADDKYNISKLESGKYFLGNSINQIYYDEFLTKLRNENNKKEKGKFIKSKPINLEKTKQQEIFANESGEETPISSQINDMKKNLNNELENKFKKKTSEENIIVIKPMVANEIKHENINKESIPNNLNPENTTNSLVNNEFNPHFSNHPTLENKRKLFFSIFII